MCIDLDPKFDRTGARSVVLAGREFWVAPLPLRHVLALGDLAAKFKGITADNISGEKLMPLIEALRRGLTKAHPKITDDDLLDLPIRVDELMTAFPVVVEQAGGKQVDPAGEQGASRSTPSTGDGSSPDS